MALCPFCKLYISTKESGKNYKGKKYHPQCFEKMLDDIESGDDDQKELNDYICKLFNIKTITPLMSSQIQSFTDTKGYTLKGIHGSLYYFFNIEGNEIGEDIKGIGIVPFVYDDAKDFFESIKKAKETNSKFKNMPKTSNVKIKRPDTSVNKIDISKI